MQITPSDTDPKKVLVTIQANTIIVTDQDGKTTTHKFPAGVTLTLSEELTFKQLFALIMQLRTEMVLSSVNEERAQLLALLEATTPKLSEE